MNTVQPAVTAYTQADLDEMGVRRFDPDASQVDALAELAAYSVVRFRSADHAPERVICGPER